MPPRTEPPSPIMMAKSYADSALAETPPKWTKASLQKLWTGALLNVITGKGKKQLARVSTVTYNARKPQSTAESEEIDLFERLDAGVKAELAASYAPKSSGPLGTAVRSLARFAKKVPSRELFLQPRVRGDLHVEAHNEWTLLLWAYDLANSVSAKTGKALAAKTIESRISLAKGLLSHRYGFQIAGEAPRLRSFVKSIKERTQFNNTRKKRRGLRKRHIKKVWQRSSEVWAL